MVQHHVVDQLQQIQNNLSKTIIEPWEELGYDKEVTFHILDYSRPIHFQSARFIQGDSISPIAVQHQNAKLEHGHRVGVKSPSGPSWKSMKYCVFGCGILSNSSLLCLLQLRWGLDL
jgi:hypothetical protein